MTATEVEANIEIRTELAMIDTLGYSEFLKANDFSETQAKALAGKQDEMLEKAIEKQDEKVGNQD